MDNLEDIYELSPMQQGILFHSLYEPESGLYFEQFCFTLQGPLDQQAFQKAWQQVVDRHGVLRTAFYWEELDKPVQVVHRNVELPWFTEDWTHLSPDEQKHHLDTFILEDRAKGFDLNVAPLMRCTLIKLAENTYELIWSHHHILLDGWCLSIILQEVWKYYEAFLQNQPIYLESPHPYQDYIIWLQQQDLAEAENFWREELKGFIAPTFLKIPELEPVSAGGKIPHQKQSLHLSSSLNKTLESLCKQNRLTLNTFLQAAWALLLSRYSGESDIVFGATVSGRPPTLPGIENRVGLFINSLPVRVQIVEKETLLSGLLKLQDKQGEREEYSYTPLVDIQRWSEIPRNSSLLSSILAFENYPLDSEHWEKNSFLKIVQIKNFTKTNYDLTLEVIPREQFQLNINYNPQKFSANTITRMLGHLKTILEAMVTDLEQPLSSLPLLSEAEKQQILYEWNNTAQDYDLDQCIHHLIERQVEQTPNQIAVTYQQHALTYQQLNEKANQVAHYLQNLGVKTETKIGIYIERSLEMLIGLLGILKAGGTYIPLDPSYPQERLEYMLQDAQIEILITQSQLQNTLPNYQGQKINLDTQVEIFESDTLDNPPSEVQGNNLAYIIYTSGSTGKPKGVQIYHQSVVNFLYSMKDSLAIASEDILLALTTISFDIAALELYLPLIVGAKVVIVSREIAIDPQQLARNIHESQATIVQATPATWRMLFKSGWQGNRNLKVLCGGEALEISLSRQLQEKSASFWNLYGPTETTIWSAIKPLKKTLNSGQNSLPKEPLGRPIANTQIYILDPYLQPVPIGVAGEIYIGGVGLAKGYLHQEKLTQAKFIPNPFSQGSSKIYQTGDLGRYLWNGEIEYLGRIDNQVKIRGFRLELGEIEACIQQHPDIQENVVMIREDQPGDQRLVAYIVSPLMPDRLPYHHQGSVEIDGQIYPLFIEDLSPGGVGVTDISPSVFTVGKIVKIYVVLPGENQQCCLMGKIAWQHYKHGGLEFSLNPDEKNTLRKSFQNLSKTGGFLKVEQRVLTKTLRQYLKEKLPEYMIPSAFVLLNALPLTPNGKVDRRSLPAPDSLARSLEEDLIAPQTPTQKTLAEIWTEVLKIEQIGIQDNFFDLGGHSLLATQVISRIREAFALELPIKSLFNHPNIAQMADLIENMNLSTKIQVSENLVDEEREEIEI